MTMPMQPGKTIELAPPSYPMLTLLLTDNFVDENAKTMRWVVSRPHPFIPDMNVMRMFVVVDRGGVEVYSFSTDGKTGMRDLIPMRRVRLAQEAMPLDVFADELALAEAGTDSEDEYDDEPEIESTPTVPPPAPSNGQTTP